MNGTIRVGKVSSIDYARGLVRVAYMDEDGQVTQPFPMLSDRYFMPAVGDQIMVLHLSNGTEAGLALGRYWTDKNVPPESGAGLFRMDMDRSGAAYLKCAEGVVTLLGGTVKVDGETIEITGSSITVTGDEIALEGNITITGDVAVTGDISVTGDVAVTGDLTVDGSVSATADVTVDGISLKSHTHKDSIGGDTSAPTT